MKTYYFTFMQRQPFKDFYVCIDAESVEDARNAMFSQFADKWAMQYTDANFRS